MRQTDKQEDQVDHALDKITELRFDAWHIDQQIRLFVTVAISNGGTWREIGHALGVSPQAAWARYHAVSVVNSKAKQT